MALGTLLLLTLSLVGCGDKDDGGDDGGAGDGGGGDGGSDGGSSGGTDQDGDGYDSIETVAAQPWVLGARVGMIGISFSGISQLYVGGARPPHLAAVAPRPALAHPRAALL